MFLGFFVAEGFATGSGGVMIGTVLISGLNFPRGGNTGIDAVFFDGEDGDGT